MIKIKTHIQTRTDGNYSLYSAENKAGYRVGDLVCIATNIKIHKGYVTVITEPKRQLKLF